MTESDTSNGPGPEAQERREILPESSSLVILLILFFGIGLVSLAVILGKPGEEVAEGAGGTRAFGPADFPELDFGEPLLEAVEAARGSAEPDSTFRVPPPPFSEDLFPCSGCHADMEPNLVRRALEEMHDDIVLDHGPEERWCFDCHNPGDRDRLRLISGELIEFDQSYRLCGQCHGTIFRDWRQGIHGRRRGYWNGPKSYLLCAHCHNPHAPRFRAVKPLPAPVRPDYLRQTVADSGAENAEARP